MNGGSYDGVSAKVRLSESSDSEELEIVSSPEIPEISKFENNKNSDGTLQNPTIVEESKILEKMNGGKKSVKTITGTFWCENSEIRNSEFERVKSVWPTSRYIIYGAIEDTEENKKPHCHFIIAFASSKMFKTILKTLSSKFYHIEQCRNFNAALEYVKKSNPEDFVEFGEPLKQGLRTDLKKLLESNNYSIEQIKENAPDTFCRYNNGLTKICEQKNRKKNMMDWLGLDEDEEGNIYETEYFKPTVHWFFGKSGLGKTREVKKIIKNLIIKNQIDINKISRIDKFDNGFAIGDLCENCELLIIDEFRGSDLKLSNLLKILDGSNLNIKGSKLYIHAKEIFITSCFSPLNVYKNLGGTDSINQLLRRITDCRKFDESGFIEYPLALKNVCGASIDDSEECIV